MNFLELLQSFFVNMPVEQAAMLQSTVSWIILAVSLLVCFFGYTVHRFWVGCVFFVIGCLLGAIVGEFVLHLPLYVVLIFALVLGVLGAMLTRRLIKVQLFMLNFYLVYSMLSRLLEAPIGRTWAAVVALVGGVLVGLLAARYHYVLTVLITACAGAAAAAPIIAVFAGWEGLPPQLAVGIPLAVLGVLMQMRMERKYMQRTREVRLKRAEEKLEKTRAKTHVPPQVTAQPPETPTQE